MILVRRTILVIGIVSLGLACGGATSDPIGSPSETASSSGSSGTSGGGGDGGGTSDGGSGECTGNASHCANKMACADGEERVEVTPGCCECRRALTCEDGRKAYATWLQTRLAEPGTLDCKEPSDCVVVTLSNACRNDCGHSVNKDAADTLVADAKKAGAQSCKECPKDTLACPAVVRFPTCREGRCAFAGGPKF